MDLLQSNFIYWTSVICQSAPFYVLETKTSGLWSTLDSWTTSHTPEWGKLFWSKRFIDFEVAPWNTYKKGYHLHFVSYGSLKTKPNLEKDNNGEYKQTFRFWILGKNRRRAEVEHTQKKKWKRPQKNVIFMNFLPSWKRPQKNVKKSTSCSHRGNVIFMNFQPRRKKK